MTIGDMVRRKDRTPNPDGGIGGLTEAELAPLAPFNDLLNAADKLCECGRCGCASPLLEPKRFLQ